MPRFALLPLPKKSLELKEEKTVAHFVITFLGELKEDPFVSRGIPELLLPVFWWFRVKLPPKKCLIIGGAVFPKNHEREEKECQFGEIPGSVDTMSLFQTMKKGFLCSSQLTVHQGTGTMHFWRVTTQDHDLAEKQRRSE